MKQFLVCLFMAIGFTATAQSDSAWFRNNYTKKEMYITMRDGIKLFTAVYMPNSTAEKHPILMSRTPYSCGPYGEENYDSYLCGTYQMQYLKEGYIMVRQDVRGRWMSEGGFKDVRNTPTLPLLSGIFFTSQSIPS